MLVTDRPSVNMLQNGRQTIALLAGSMSSEYQEEIMRGAAYVASEKDYNLIVFCGGAINSEDPLTLARGKVFDLVNMDFIAGIISPFSSHMRFLNSHASQAFIDRFSSVPIINIGSQIDGHTNILTDYETGFSELFEHLYRDHGYRNILLVRGPEHHASSDKRTALYKKLLAKYELPFEPEMVIYSDLNRIRTKLNVGRFFDQSKKNNKKFDVIIALNDNQALGVIDACQERDICVPDEIAVVGSMNSLEGVFSTPPLTSIKEPLFELGRVAAMELIAQIEGCDPLPNIEISTSLIIRKSCGCESSTHSGRYGLTDKSTLHKLTIDEDPIFQDTEICFNKIVEQYKGGIIKESANLLLTAYHDAIYLNSFDGFLNFLKKSLDQSLKSEDILVWLALTARLEISSLRYLNNQPECDQLIVFLRQLIEIKNNVEQIAIKYQIFENQYYLNYFRGIVNGLNNSFDLISIQRYIVDVLQISELYISLFDGDNESILTAKNMVAVRNSQLITVKNKKFLAKNILPNGVKTYQDRYTLMVFPLSFRKKHLGFMTINLSDRKGDAFENLRAIISSALKNEILIQDLQRAEKRFSDIAHSTSNWLWETNIAHEFTYCSESSLEIIGYSPEALLGRKINAFNLDQEDSCITRMCDHEDLTEYECWYKHHNGNVICLLISAKAIFINDSFIGYCGIFEDITEQRLQKDKINNLAYSDILTGLPNRTLFQEQLAETIASSALHQKKFALMFIDLDHFKHINDSMGHAIGDQLLVKIAKRLSFSIRSHDMLARLGGDEFVIILPEIANDAGVIEVAERIFSHIKEPLILNDKMVYIGLSLGISLYPQDGIESEVLLKKGDNAMYQAKSQGRNNYVFYDKLLDQKYALRHRNEEILREALITKSFILNYQPQVSAETGNIIGFEALVRIETRDKDIILPNHFISLAEELGLIDQIDTWVFEKACAQHKAWQEMGFVNIRLSINLSALQLQNMSVLETYIRIIKSYNINPTEIQIEITENALIKNEQVVLNILQGFKHYGVRIALDDFGTGYSSLNCINLYPIDTIKIDRSFVKDAADNPKNKALIEGIILIASHLNLNIIAEGVETKAQYELMKSLGCHEIQGYFFYTPCSAENTQILLENNRLDE